MIYISGKITGDENYKEKFAKAKQELIDEGYKESRIINPAEISSPSQATHSDYMDVCLSWLNKCNVIYLLKDWKDSKGALVEFGYALAIDCFVEYQK